MSKGCHARRYGDEMSCGACGLTWDYRDPEPPACRPEPPPKLRELPDELPAHVAARMWAHLEQTRRGGACHVTAIRAAYRVLQQHLEK